MIELMVTLAVLAILLTIGVPSMRTLILNNRLTTATNNLAAAINMARSEAVKQGVTTVLCTSNDQATCTGNAWTTGWLVWADANSNTTLDAPGEIIRVAESLKGTTTVTATVTTLVFDGTGFTTTPATIKVCDDRTGNLGKQLRILAGGSVSLTSQVACP